jgi:hypothetical protein
LIEWFTRPDAALSLGRNRAKFAERRRSRDNKPLSLALLRVRTGHPHAFLSGLPLLAARPRPLLFAGVQKIAQDDRFVVQFVVRRE